MESFEGCNCSSCLPTTFEIFTGQDKTMTLQAKFQQPPQLPLDLTECTAITVNLPNADGTFTELTLAGDQLSIISPANYGQISVPILAAVSAILNVGPRQNVDVDYTIGGLITTVRYVGALTVLQSPG
jgi:hypothetical protein